MSTIIQLLEQYPALTPSERSAVDARLEGQPEWAEAWAEARRLAAFADALDVTARDVARAAVDRRMGYAVPDAEAIDRAIAADPALAAEAARVSARLGEVETAAEDPIARFERLSGLTVPTPSSTSESSPSEGSTAVRPLLTPRPAARRLRLAPLAAAAGVLIVVYGGLFVVSASSVSPRQQVAALSEVETTVPDALRGPGALADADDLADALGPIDDARRSTLGLFPRYDADALDEAADALAAVARDADPRSWVSQEARLALGRVLVQQGRDAEAVRVLGGLVREGSYRASLARRLLDFVRTENTEAD